MQAVQNEFGNGYTVADWNDLKAISDINAWIACMGLVDEQSFNLLRNGDQIYSGDRQYFMRYCSDGDPGANFLIYDQIGSYIFLGSWTGHRPVLAKISINVMTKDLSSNDLLIYPNPFSDYIRIKSNEEIQRIYLTNISGQKIIDIINPESEIKTTKLEPGIYFVTVFFKDKQILTKKLVKISE